MDAIGRLWQLCTVQFDFNLPARFGLEYVGEDGKRHQPLMVHRALYGSIERFFGVLIEHYAGAFPVWLSPVQVVVIPIGEKHHAYANEVGDKLKAAGVRVHVDVRNEKMNAKIREHAMQKVPFQLVVWATARVEAGEVNVRVRGQEKAEGSVKAGGVRGAGEGADRKQEPRRCSWSAKLARRSYALPMVRSFHGKGYGVLQGANRHPQAGSGSSEPH